MARRKREAQPNTDERALRSMRRIAAGDREALGALYDQLAPVVLAVAYRLLGARREAEDLVHDIFLEVWQHAQDYDPARASVRTWLLMRVRSRARDRMRRAQRAGKAALDEAWLRAADVSHVDPAVARDAQRLHGIVLDLPAEQRAVLELSYFAGYSNSEIARELAVPLGTVKSRMARALLVLRLRLRGAG